MEYLHMAPFTQFHNLFVFDGGQRSKVSEGKGEQRGLHAALITGNVFMHRVQCGMTLSKFLRAKN